MSDSISTKSTVIIINAIAITAALAIISGYVPLSAAPLTQLQAFLNQATATQR